MPMVTLDELEKLNAPKQESKDSCCTPSNTGSFGHSAFFGLQDYEYDDDYWVGGNRDHFGLPLVNKDVKR